MKELLNDVEKLKGMIASVEKEELVSIHFFSEAFDLLYKVQEGLIAMESAQIERLRRDMEMRKVKLSGLRNEEAATPEKEAAPLYEQPEPPKAEGVSDNPIVSEKTKQVIEEIAAPVVAPVSVETKAEKQASKDIRVLLSLNDRFLFQRELFAGDVSAFNGFLDRLNLTTSFAEATELIRSETHWSNDNETATEFSAVVERFFTVNL